MPKKKSILLTACSIRSTYGIQKKEHKKEGTSQDIMLVPFSVITNTYMIIDCF